MSQTPDPMESRRQDAVLDWLTQDHRASVDFSALDADQLAAEEAAATYVLASLDRMEPMPADVRRRLLESALVAAAGLQAATAPLKVARMPWWANFKLAWGSASLATAVAVMLAVRLATLPADSTRPLIVLADSSHYNLQPGPDAAGQAVQGEVVWDPARNGGLVKLSGLPVNDPNREQYQLWIFDAMRDQRYPVDGGVFNIVRNGEAEVWIRVPIPVRKAAMFAVTVEKAGGTVVSDRSRIVALAKTGT